ncbi:T9SS sorting signal type C domain-containing protein [Flavobacterium aquiphilum]|uniref:T9SS sorting signal type C domain-containing protein n=1 Tax=Flavobacterium aquiphilum TaxID=3003261 RepID=UPI002480892B|nr:T9SS sorting signal type C domain-containing protein [Flavobacterium aquiphilum]
MKKILLLINVLFFVSQMTFGKEVGSDSFAITKGNEVSFKDVSVVRNTFSNKIAKNKINAVTERNRVWLNFTNTGGAFKQILVGYVTGATNGWDNLYDGVSMDSNPYVDFYSINSDKYLTIQGRALPFVNTDVVPLGYKTVIAGTFEISIDHVDGVLVNQDIFLEDKTTGVFHNLKKGSYSFSTSTGRFNDRFVLVYIDNTVVATPPANVDPVVTDPVVIVPPVTQTPVASDPVVTAPTPIVSPPVVTDPVVTAPTPVVTEPVVVVVDPVVTPPAVTDPVVTAPTPVVSDPVVVVADPVVSPPAVTDPVVTAPTPVVTEPVVVVVDPVVTPPAVTDPVVPAPTPVVSDPVVVVVDPVVTPPAVTDPVVPAPTPVVSDPVVVVVDPVVTPPAVTDPVVPAPTPVVSDPVVVVTTPIVSPPAVTNPNGSNSVVTDPNNNSNGLVTTNKNRNKAIISINNDQIKVNTIEQTIDMVSVYDLKGKLLYEMPNVNSSELIIQNLNSTNQVLLIKTQLKSGKLLVSKTIF